jgi:transglutaminase/protease-like cytokinesis protein 3
MKFLKFLIAVLSVFTLFVLTIGFLDKEEILDTVIDYYNKTPTMLNNNEYTKEVDVDFIKLTDDFIANNKDELINIYYTIISSGMQEFTFYCDNEYSECLKDVESINNDSTLLSQINNFVNVFNSFKSIKTTYTNYGKVTLSINRIYKSEDIENINNKIDSIFDSIVDKNKSDYDNILAIHDYIINNTKYDVESEKNPYSNASTAIGVLFDNKATCNGYTDTMSIFLDRLNIKNVKISNDTHIWNLVYVETKWVNLDVTWDDPINNLNRDMILHDYFLITKGELAEIDEQNPNNKHIYDEEIYNFMD